MSVRSPSRWYARLEGNRRLRETPVPTLQAADRLGCLPPRKLQGTGSRNTTIITGAALLLLLLTPFASTLFGRHKDSTIHLPSGSQIVTNSNIDSNLPADTVNPSTVTNTESADASAEYRENTTSVRVDTSSDLEATVTQKSIIDGTTTTEENRMKVDKFAKKLESISASRDDISPEKSLSSVIKVLSGALVAYTVMAVALQQVSDCSVPGILQEALIQWRAIEVALSRQNNLATLLKQAVFLSVCEKVLLPGQFLSGLYTLMFCTVVTYCVGYAMELFYRQQWNLIVTIGGPTSSVRHLALSTTNIVLEWTKAVTFITTVVFFLLMMGLEKGLINYTPTAPYMFVATLYWLASEKVCVVALSDYLLDHRLRCLDSLEEVYVPVLLGVFQLSVMAVFTLPCVLMGHYRLGLAGAVVCRVGYLQLANHYLALSSQLSSLAIFRHATSKELSQRNDRCAICLSGMDTARVTSCQHYYHAECLLQLLRHLAPDTPKCPICQSDLSWTTHCYDVK